MDGEMEREFRIITRPRAGNLVITQIFALADALFGRVAT
jgi:hypothetical protein